MEEFMKYTLLEGKEKGKNAQEFFDKSGQYESTNSCSLMNLDRYMGIYQVNIDIIGDLEWYDSNNGYIVETKEKWE